jgi:superfamily II DNA or RNA helicase
MAEQLPLDFSESAAVRHRRAVKAATAPAGDDRQPRLFVHAPNIDVHLHSVDEAIAQIAGADPDRTAYWLQQLVGAVRAIKGRRVAFPTAALDRLLYLRPPAQVTLDASALAVARAIWAAKLGLRPLRVHRDRQRLLASSVRWPAGFAVKDAPWPAIATIEALGLPLEVDARAQALMTDKLVKAGTHIASAGLAGSAVILETTRPDLLERLKLPGLSYAGSKESGRYRMPLLAAESLLAEPAIRTSPELESAIRKATAKVKPLVPPDGFPWTLYGFQARDAARGKRILETTGGVLLAGTMGSGKTTVSLALAADMDIWPLLVVAPLAAFSTWARQLGEMGRSYYLAKEAPAKSWAAIETGDWDAVVISYDRLHAFVELIERQHYAGIIADELQRIRTPGSRRSRAIRTLASAVPLRIGLSGTPLTNKLDDLLPLGAFLVPGEWKPRANAKDLEDLYPGDPVEAVADHLGSMMVRRTMEQTGVKLPDRNLHRIMVALTPEQRRALEDLEAEAEAAKESGELENEGKLHAFVRLQRMRQIVADPVGAGIGGRNPKIDAAVDLVEEFLEQDRKGVVFCADRRVWREIGAELDRAGIGWTGIWGSTPIQERIDNEKRFHTDPNCKIVLCTVQAASESVTFSPTATFLICLSYVYAPSTMDQMEARIYRMNTVEPVEICYLHAKAPGGTLDDRMVEILTVKRELFAKVVDRTTHTDSTKVHYSMGDLVYLLTGKRDDALDRREADAKATVKREQAKKRHARVTAHRHKGKNKTGEDFFDDGSTSRTLEEWMDDEDGSLSALAGDEGESADRDDDFDVA